jgi:peptidyl-prolyl cis-trans isomerase D
MAEQDRNQRRLPAPALARAGRGLLLATTAAALVACGDEAESGPLVARAGDYQLTVADAVELLVDEENLPTQATVIRSLAELWVDYTLLAEAAADDSTFQQIDFDGVVRPMVEQLMVLELRDSVIQVDTAITADELEQLYASESPDVELRARHILLSFPVQATEAQRDSVRARLADIRAQIVAGASFEDMARRYSQDPGSAASGGDLGVFGPGEMVLPFEEAVMELEPGELSDVVQTPLGLHLIRLESRRVRAFDEIAPDYRAYVLARNYAQAESTFIAGLEGRSVPTLTEGAVAAARELAVAPDTRLSGQAARRPLLEWEGGSYTAGEFLELVRAEQGALRDEILRRGDDELAELLRGQARRELLIEEARRSGLEPPTERVDSLTAEARRQLRDATRSIGLLTPDRAPGEAREPAIQRAVREALADNLSGATRIVPLGLVGYQLREGVPIAIFDAGIGQVMLQVAQVRASRAPSALEQGLGAGPAPEDTTAR